MNKREKLLLTLLFCGILASGLVQADWKSWLKSATESVSEQQMGTNSTVLSNDQIIQGLKEALTVGTEKAIGILGREGGYLNDAEVRIPLPGGLKSIAKGLRSLGQDELVDEFEETINRAAEQAVPETISIFSDTIRQMTLEDANGILNGNDTAATDYFRDKSNDRLSASILPIVQQSTERTGVTAAYKKLTGNVGFLSSYVDMDRLDLDKYVTEKAVSGLFIKLAEQEQLIRKDPVARTTDLLKTVFSSVSK